MFSYGIVRETFGPAGKMSGEALIGLYVSVIAIVTNVDFQYMLKQALG